MSGHSKWANIQHRKGIQDRKRSTEFTKIAKNILTAIREGGGNTNPDANNSLRTAIERARTSNMPKENIERLLKRFEERKANLSNFMLEGYAPGGIPLMIEVETDNKNRTLGEIKLTMRNHEGIIGEAGTVGFQFDKKGEIELEQTLPEDKQLEVIDLGVEDIEDNYLYVNPTELAKVANQLRGMGLTVVGVSMVMIPKNPMVITNEEAAGKVVDLIEELEDNEDVVNVFAGFKYQNA